MNVNLYYYQDHRTKFIQLIPLKSKIAEEVAHYFLNILLKLNLQCANITVRMGEYFVTVNDMIVYRVVINET